MTHDKAVQYLFSLGWLVDVEGNEYVMFPPKITRPIVRTKEELPAYAEGVKRAIERDEKR